WCGAARLQYHGCVRRLVLRTERRLLVQREMNLRRLHPRHLADRALELSFECAPVIDSLREVSHSPRRLIEQLHAGTSSRRKPRLRQSHPRTRNVVGAHQNVAAATIQLEPDPGSRELVRHLT